MAEKSGGLMSTTKMSGEHCEIAGVYKAHCVHAMEGSFTKGQQLPRCERCPFDVLWVLARPELLGGQRSSSSFNPGHFLISKRTTTAWPIGLTAAGGRGGSA